MGYGTRVDGVGEGHCEGLGDVGLSRMETLDDRWACRCWRDIFLFGDPLEWHFPEAGTEFSNDVDHA